MDCEHCNRRAAPEMVSRYAMEELAARQDIANRRSHRLNILLIILLLASWIGFVVYEAQFEEQVITQEVSQDTGSGDNSYSGNVIGGDYYGEAESQNNG